MKSNSLMVLIATAALMLVLIAGTGAAWYMVGELRERSKILSEELERQKEREVRYARSGELLDTLEEARRLMEQHVVSESTIVSVLSLFEETGEASTVSVSVLSVQQKPEEKSVEVSILIEGSFANVMKTLRAYEQLPVSVSIVRGGVSTILEGGASSGRWSASLTYRLPSYNL